jgi:hypothetical protein
MVSERQEGSDVVVRHHPDATTVATVATVGSALGDMGLPTK